MEELINDHIAHQRDGTHTRSKLKLLIPSVGVFFTPLLLEEAFEYQDLQRRISSRRFVPPSFNDIRLILNSAQILSLVRGGPLHLVTFDGDVTLYGMYLIVLLMLRFPNRGAWNFLSQLVSCVSQCFNLCGQLAIRYYMALP